MSGFLDKVYDTGGGVDETRKLYDDWAATYEAEVGENGYVTPRRVAEALYGFIEYPDLPILDFGCGTGLSGLALRAAGFEVIDGLDLSSDMLEKARAKGIYRSLRQIDGESPLPFLPGTYQAIAAIGVIGSGAAPLSVLHTLFEALEAGQFLAFSFNDHTLADPAYDGAVDAYIRQGLAELKLREYGPHLPGKNINSNVYVLEKL